MGEAFIVRRGGGGAGGLNFRVIGGTSAPSNPKENDIWVNTDVEIPNWAFTAKEPISNEISIDCAIGLDTTYLASDGTETYYPASVVTEYVKLPDNTVKITTVNTDLETANMGHAFYDANKTFISFVSREPGTTTYEVPSGAVYVRLSVYNSRDPMYFVATIGMKNGFVWISTGTSSAVEFNALKKNNITVYPISAKQYVGGAWVAKTVKSYQGGEWVDWWTNELYTPGNEWEAITGGWTGTGVKSSSTSGAGAAVPVITRGADRITAEGIYGGGVFHTAKKINLKKFSYITFKGNFTRGGTAGINLLCGCWASFGTYYSASYAAATEMTATSKTEITVNVSNLDDEYYVGIGLIGNSKAEITSILLS